MKLSGFLVVAVTLVSTSTLNGTRIYVDVDSAAAEPDGSSWAMAHPDLMTALTDAQAGTEVWVAEGTYKPSTDDRTAFFPINPQLKLFGGFDGTESSLDERDVSGHPTILSGDLAGDDEAEGGSNEENSYTIAIMYDQSVVDGFTFIGGNANAPAGQPQSQRFGGAIFTEKPRATILNCKFFNNTGQQGGAVYGHYYNRYLFVENCHFDSNSTNQNYADGGAIYVSDCYQLVITNCRFTRNSATSGGAVYSRDSTSIIHGSIFAGNEATAGGGGYGASSSPTLMTNCTLVGNTAKNGPAIMGGTSQLEFFLHNNIVANNVASNDTSRQIESYGMVISHCAIPEGWESKQYDNIFVDEILTGSTGMIDPDGLDDIYGTEDDNYALASDSACIGAGSNRHVQGDLIGLFQNPKETDRLLMSVPDLAGNDRIQGKHVDIGALEYSDNGYTPTTIFVKADAGGTGDGSSWGNAYTTLQAAFDSNPGNGDEIWVAAGTYTPSKIPLGQDRGQDNVEICRSFELPGAVKIYGSFAGTESSLEERNIEEQASIISGDINGDDGTEGGSIADNVTSLVQAGSLVLLDGFIIEKAYSANQPHSNDVHRAWPSYDDGGGIRCFMRSPLIENCWIRNRDGINASAVYCKSSMARFENCMIEANDSSSGAVVNLKHSYTRWNECSFMDNLRNSILVQNDGSRIEDCYFENNTGGTIRVVAPDNVLISGCTLYNNANTGIEVGSQAATIENCVFEANRSGAAISLQSTAVLVKDCDFKDNAFRAVTIGAGSSPSRFINCRFSGNSFDRGAAAGISCEQASPQFFNCLFWGNSADAMPGAHYDGEGGCVYNFIASPSFTNCTFAYNYADQGSVIYNAYDSHPKLYNCILWGNTGGAQIVNTGSKGSSTTIVNSIVEGGAGGEGNLNLDPLFFDANGDDGIWGNDDDNFRLRTNSPALEAADVAHLPVDTYDLDNDGNREELLPFDLDANERIQNTHPDIGAYEGDAGTPVFPDLVITGISVSPENPGARQEATFTVQVMNQGTVASGDFEVGFWHHSVNQPEDPRNPVQTNPAEPLEPGASTSVDFNFTPNSTSIMTAWAFVDPAPLTGLVDETDETNNWSEGLQYEVITKYPDLIITGVTVEPETPMTGQIQTFAVTVQNIGEVPTYLFYLSCWPDKDTAPAVNSYATHYTEHSGLASGESAIMTIDYTPTEEGNYRTWFFVDTAFGSGRIHETDEDNNLYPTEGLNWSVEDTIPDAWEIAMLGTTRYNPDEDPDGNTFTIADEFLIGNAPGESVPPFNIQLVQVDGDLQIHLDANGTEAHYGDLERHYRLESSPSPGGPWTPVPGFEDVIGNDSLMMVDIPDPVGPIFYQCTIWLE